MCYNSRMNRWEDDTPNINLDIDAWLNYKDYPILHDHDYWEFFVVCQGSYKHKINGKDEIVYKNSGYFIRPHDYHAIYDNEKDSFHLNVMMKKEYIKEICDLYSSNTYNLLLNHKELPFHLNDNQVNKLLVYSSMLNSIGETIDKKLIGHLMVGYVLEKAISQNDYTDNTKPKWLQDILMKINDPHNMAWDVQDVLANCGYSHSHFARIFKSYMNCTLIDYLKMTKMSNAQDLLIHSNMSMLEISINLGYSSLSRFNHIFKDYYHMSPGQYKKTIKNKNVG